MYSYFFLYVQSQLEVIFCPLKFYTLCHGHYCIRSYPEFNITHPISTYWWLSGECHRASTLRDFNYYTDFNGRLNCLHCQNVVVGWLSTTLKSATRVRSVMSHFAFYNHQHQLTTKELFHHVQFLSVKAKPGSHHTM